MSNPIADVLQRYIDEIKSDTNKKVKNTSRADTVKAEASAIGVSVGTLSQLRNGKIITDRVIEKIIKKIAGDDSFLKEKVKGELEKARELSINAATKNDPLEAFHKFFETSPNDKRLICISYRDIPESRDKGNYPGYADKSALVIRDGLACAMFQPFGPLKEIKKKAKESYDKDNVEAAETWNYIYKLASGVREVFEKIKNALQGADGAVADADADKGRGQLVLYEALRDPSLAGCDVNSRLFYSQQISGKDKSNKIRVVQLIKGEEKDREYFIECSTEPAFQAAVAAQFYPIISYWRDNGSLPVRQEKIRAYCGDNEECLWAVYGEVSL